MARFEHDFHLIANPTLLITLALGVPMTFCLRNVWVSETAFENFAVRTSVSNLVVVVAGFAASATFAALT